jgi:cytochrome c oxidase subunit 2
MKNKIGFISFLCGSLLASTVFADDRDRQDWMMNFSDAASPVAESIHDFHWLVLLIITAITLFVLFLLIYVCIKFRKKANPKPSKTTHNVLIEVVWTVLPVLILLMIAVPSLRLLYMEEQQPKDGYDMTIKATATMWRWDYEYNDVKLKDGSLLAVSGGYVEDANLKEGDLRNLTTDQQVVVPVNKNIHILITSGDVIHSWAMPSFGVKKDAVPGRINETWFRATKTGIYYGQCSELCGTNHAFMPIMVRVVSQENYDKWVEAAKTNVDDANKLLSDLEAGKSPTAQLQLQ